MNSKRWTKTEMQLIQKAAAKFRIGILRLAFNLHSGDGLEHREVNLIVKKLRRARNKMIKLNVERNKKWQKQ